MATNQSVKQFQALLASLPPGIRGPLQAVTFEQASNLAGGVSLAAPRGAGTLKASVRVEASPRSPMRALVKAGGPTTAMPNGYDYANAVEFGTVRTPAQPFFWPTYRAKKRAIRRAIKAAATVAIGKLVKLT